MAENTAALCSNAIGQYIFGALAHVSFEELRKWYSRQREYYSGMLASLTDNLKQKLPGIIVSSPDASIYSVADVRNIAKPGFSAQDFVLWCAAKGKINIDGIYTTLLVSPMAEFYNVKEGEKNQKQFQNH